MNRIGETGIGAALRAEREQRRISLDAVARGTLVRMDFLQLIEADRLEELPTGAYAKGFIRSYAAFLGVDPRPYLDAYEERCGQPAPELSPLVRRGIRVPPAAQPRARRMAVASALGLLLILGLFGAFRSSDGPSRAETEVLSNRIAESAAPASSGTTLRIEVTDTETWVEAEVDGQAAFAQTLRPGEYQTFRGEETIRLSIARPRAVSITANGEILGAPDTDGYTGVFTPDTEALPANEQAVGAEATTSPVAGTSEGSP